MVLTSNGFAIIRNLLGTLKQSQVDALNYLVNGMQLAGFTYPECAYALATVMHETNKTFEPIAEYGSYKYLSKYDTGVLAKRLGNTSTADGDGQRYKGRGYVQITGTDNYKRIGKLLGIDLYNKPELSLDRDVALKILTGGMLNGWFTGKGFRKGCPVQRYDVHAYTKARTIINGTDKAKTIAEYAMVFEKALRSV